MNNKQKQTLALVITLLLSSMAAFSQQKTAIRYYEGTQKKLIEYQYIIGEKAKIGNVIVRDDKTKLITDIDNSTYTAEQRILHGYWKEFYEDGTLRVNYNYTNGVREGEAKHFHENGKLKEKFNFNNGIIDGEFISYYDNGMVTEKCTYVQGVRFGTASVNDYEGNPLYNLEYSKPENGVAKIYARSIYANGKLAQEGFFHSKYSMDKYSTYYDVVLRNGIWKFYNEEGIKESEENYFNGQLQGKMNTFYVNGQIAEEKYYKPVTIQDEQMSIIDGPYKSWYETGELAKTGIMKTLVTKSKTNEGELDEKEYPAGDWRRYDKSGKMIEFLSLGRGDEVLLEMDEKVIEEQSNINETLEFTLYKQRSVEKLNKYFRFHFTDYLTAIENFPEDNPRKQLVQNIMKETMVLIGEYQSTIKSCSDKTCILDRTSQVNKILSKLSKIASDGRRDANEIDTLYMRMENEGIKTAFGLD